MLRKQQRPVLAAGGTWCADTQGACVPTHTRCLQLAKHSAGPNSSSSHFNTCVVRVDASADLRRRAAAAEGNTEAAEQHKDSSGRDRGGDAPGKLLVGQQLQRHNPSICGQDDNRQAPPAPPRAVQAERKQVEPRQCCRSSTHKHPLSRPASTTQVTPVDKPAAPLPRPACRADGSGWCWQLATRFVPPTGETHPQSSTRRALI